MYQVSVGAAQPFHAFLTDLATAGSTVDLFGRRAGHLQGDAEPAEPGVGAAGDGLRGGGRRQWRDVLAGNCARAGSCRSSGADWRERASATTVDFDGDGRDGAAGVAVPGQCGRAGDGRAGDARSDGAVGRMGRRSRR